MEFSELVGIDDGDTGIVNLECFFLSNKEKSLLVDDLEKMNVKVDVSAFGFYELLDGVLSRFGGGKWDYYDKCSIKARFIKSDNSFVLDEVFIFSVMRNAVHYVILPTTDVNKISTNIDKAFQNLSSCVDLENELTGYLVLNDNGVSLNSHLIFSSRENRSIKVSVPRIEDIIEYNFIPDDKWPDYEALVKVTGKLRCFQDGTFELITATHWEIIYPNVVIQFEGVGRA